MEFVQAMKEIRTNWRRLIGEMLPPARQNVNGETSYICPFCDHGRNGDGLTFDPTSRDGNTLKCFGCGFSGDVIDLYEKMHHTTKAQAVHTLAQKLGIALDWHDFDKPETAPTIPAQRTAQRTAQPDYSAYYTECAARLVHSRQAREYLKARGISIRTAAAYGLGFDPEADPAQSGHKAPRLIIPTTSAHYVARAIDEQTAPAFKKMNPKGSAPGIFNGSALYSQDAQEVFITEGAFDALSVLEVGADAIAINSTANIKALLKQLEARRTEATLILALDSDQPGRSAEAALKQGLKLLNIPCFSVDLCGAFKDPNEFLQKDREQFAQTIQTAQRRSAPKPDSVGAYIETDFARELREFKSDVKTGFKNLDEKAGGLYSGLYVIAAISSLGKTTFAHQMADQIAEAGHDVIYFSLEQSRLELVTKSIARRIYQATPEFAETSLNLRRRCTGLDFRGELDEYKKAVGDRLSIIEANYSCDAGYISDYVRRYIERNKVTPVVFVDYLQILQPSERGGTRTTARDSIDATTTELKRLTRDLGITAIVISSVNRANYLTPVSFESLKESGIIEFTADVVWGLQLSCLTSEAGGALNSMNKIVERRQKIAEEKAKNPRNIDLVCLKNRYGPSGFVCNFEYRPAYDYFTPGAELPYSWVSLVKRI